MQICHVNLAKGFSGGERQTLNLIRSLAAQGVEQWVVIRPDSSLNDKLAGLNVTVVHAKHHLLGHHRRWLPKSVMLHAHDGKAVYWCALQGLLHGNRYIITRRVDNKLKSSALTRLAYRNAATVVGLSRAIEAQILTLDNRITTRVIPSSFSTFAADPQRVAEIQAQYPDKILIGQVGKLLHHKGYHLTIEVARRLAKTHPQLQFLFLGSGKDESQLKQQAQGIDNIEFLGHCDDIGNYLAAMKLMLFPSLNEGLGSTVLEAWQHDTPVIGANAGGIPDMIVDGQTGLLVEPGDDQAIERALLTLLADESLQQQLAAGAKERLRDFSPQSVCERYLALYNSLTTV